MRVRRAYKANGLEQRKYLVPESGFEAGFLRWLAQSDEKYGRLAGLWPCTHGKEMPHPGHVTVLRFMMYVPDDRLRSHLEEVLGERSPLYHHVAPPAASPVTLAPPFDRDQWDVMDENWLETFIACCEDEPGYLH